MATPIALDTRARAKSALSYLQGFGNELAGGARIVASRAGAAEMGAFLEACWNALAPELVLTAALCIVLVADLWLPREAKWIAMPLSAAGLFGGAG